MIFKELSIAGVYLISLEKHEDDRGFFARTFCKNEFAQHGLATDFVQCNLSYNRVKGTLRGMHFQRPPHAEIKIVSCLRGAIYDVVLDIREGSKTYGKWLAEDLTEENHDMLYIPAGLAHGFQTLADETLVYYQMSEFYAPKSAAGIRYNDERFKIKWAGEVTVISEKDKSYT